ncbi:hypothetical protein J6T66_00885 [bacterium]|nr:hypothetical protein [bacterium]
MATSVQSFILTHMLAFTKDGASFIPSPTIITSFHSSTNSQILSAFSVGKTSEMTVLIHSSLAIIFAVVLLSHVSIIVSIHLRLNSLITEILSFLTVSFTQINQIILLFSITYSILHH